MASLNSLPNEILQNIIRNVPVRPFKTEFLLINKALCNLIMIEQVRNLELHQGQVGSWLKLITNGEDKNSCLTLQYCNILNKVYTLDIYTSRDDHEELSVGAMASFINRCLNLRKLRLSCAYSKRLARWDISPIICQLPFNIIEIGFTGVNMGNEESQLLAEYLKQSTKMAILRLNNTAVDTDGIRVISEALKHNSTLTHLDLDANRIVDKGAYFLSDCLRNNSVLTHLYLRENKIGHEGACALSNCLKHNSTLTHLNLRLNRLGDEGARILANCLNQNSAITNLNLGSNGIHVEGACAIAKCLKKNSTITHFYLGGNVIGTKGARALSDCLKQNSTIVELSFYGMPT